MTAHATPVGFLRRAALLAAVLALIAGIFGMHIMTVTHDMHSAAMAPAGPAAHHDSSAAGHPGEHMPGSSSAPGMSGAEDEAGTRSVQCTGPDGCTSMQAMTADCTLSAKTGSLDAPLPGTGIIARITSTGPAGAVSARWAHLPGSPSPGELCISRT